MPFPPTGAFGCARSGTGHSPQQGLHPGGAQVRLAGPCPRRCGCPCFLDFPRQCCSSRGFPEPEQYSSDSPSRRKGNGPLRHRKLRARRPPRPDPAEPRGRICAALPSFRPGGGCCPPPRAPGEDACGCSSLLPCHTSESGGDADVTLVPETVRAAAAPDGSGNAAGEDASFAFVPICFTSCTSESFVVIMR